MSDQQGLKISAVQAVAAAERESVTTLAAQLLDGGARETEIKQALIAHIENLTKAAEEGQLALLTRHIKEIGRMILYTDAQDAVQLACLLLETVDQLAESTDCDENEAEEKLKPLLDAFKASLSRFGEDTPAVETASNSSEWELGHPEPEPEPDSDSIRRKIEAIDALLDSSGLDFSEEALFSEDLMTEEILSDDPFFRDFFADAGANDDNIDNDDASDDPSDSEENVLVSLIAELEELRLQLRDIARHLASINGNDIVRGSFIQARQAYQTLLARVTNAAIACDLTGLQFVCEFVAANLESVDSVNDAFAERLGDWPEVMIFHLQDPLNDKLCIAVGEYLENTAWPQPLDYSQTRELLDGLTQTSKLSEACVDELRQAQALPAQIALNISGDANSELVSAFFSEAPDHAEHLSASMQSLIHADGDRESINAIIPAAQRVAHTLKGSAQLLGIAGISNFAHQLEDIFEFLNSHSARPSLELCHSLAQAGDCIETMLDCLQGNSAEPDDALSTLQDLIDWAILADSGDLDALTKSTTEVRDEVDGESPVQTSGQTSVQNASPETLPDPHTTSGQSEELIGELVGQLVDNLVEPPNPLVEPLNKDTVRVSRSLLDKLFNLVGETSIALAQMREKFRLLGESSRVLIQQEHTLQARRFELEKAVSIKGLSMKQAHADRQDSDFDSMEMDQYDEFYGVAHSFIEVVDDNRMAMKALYQDVNALDGLALHQQTMNRELQDLVISTRLEAVQSLNNRLQRCVRQASRLVGKNVELHIEGGHLMMDGDMLKQLADPLMHILRNAVAHGIEKTADREAADKPPQGNIFLGFRQQGKQILVTCHDDGAGLNFSAIRQKALAKGLLHAHQKIDERGLSRMLLQSGFSTREEASELSGRGVGLDVVHNTIQELKGTMELGNDPQGGALITLNLPVTLLTNHSLLVESAGERFAIPGNHLEQILSPGLGELIHNAGNPGYQFEGKHYPFTSLRQLLVGGEVDIRLHGDSTILLVKGESETVAVAIDQAIAADEMVIKSAGEYLESVKSVVGMSILGDGNLVPVLNMTYLLAESRDQKHRAPHASLTNPVVKQETLPKVLIVDDSLSVRSALSQLMEDSGFIPILARDGMEALELMEKEAPHIVLTDLEMPRLNGLELTRQIRMGERSHTPVIMLTSRTMQKHRNEATNVGVSVYLTKPFSEDDLLVVIQNQLQAQARRIEGPQ